MLIKNERRTSIIGSRVKGLRQATSATTSAYINVIDVTEAVPAAITSARTVAVAAASGTATTKLLQQHEN